MSTVTPATTATLNEVLAINSNLTVSLASNPRLVAAPEFALEDNKLKVISTIKDTFGNEQTTTDFWNLTPDNRVDISNGMTYKTGRH